MQGSLSDGVSLFGRTTSFDGASSMPQTTAEVDTYFSDLEPDRQAALERVRELIFETVPGLSETMRYRMPTYELDEVVVALASQKNYMSLYMDTELVEKYRSDLGHLNCGKSCVRFRKIDELPLETIQRIIEETVTKQQHAQP
jgi:uncharacterized protein YdhG (YjbR/CyaY superfamily)